MGPYIALIHKDADSDYGVSFPDLPGCITAGASLDEARDMAAEALALHIEGLLEDGETIPEPSGLEQVMSDRLNHDGVAVMISAPNAASKTIRVNITLPADVLDAVDRFAALHGYTRSGFLVRAARQAMADRGEG